MDPPSSYNRQALHPKRSNGSSTSPPPPPPPPRKEATSSGSPGPSKPEEDVHTPIGLNAVYFGLLKMEAGDEESGLTRNSLRLNVKHRVAVSGGGQRRSGVSDDGVHIFRLNINYRHFLTLHYSFANRLPTVMATLSTYAAGKIRHSLAAHWAAAAKDSGAKDADDWFVPTSNHSDRRFLILRLRPDSVSSNLCTRLPQTFREAAARLQQPLKLKCESVEEMRVILAKAIGAENLPPQSPPAQPPTVKLQTIRPGVSSAQMIATSEVGSRKRKGPPLLPPEFMDALQPKPHELEKGPELELDKVKDPGRDLFSFPPGEKGAVTIRLQDVESIAPTEFINDTLIDFYLLYLVRKLLPASLQPRIHVFSTFFFSTLTKKVSAGAKCHDFIPKHMRSQLSKDSDAKAFARHNNVKKWTKGVDLFAKDFIVVPINEDMHWYLAIVCFPGKVSAPAAPASATKSRSFDSAPTVMTTRSSRGDAAPVKTEEAGEGSSKQPPETPLATARRADSDGIESLAQVPCILVFNSLLPPANERPKRGPPEELRDYLRVEWLIRRGLDAAPPFTAASLPGHYLQLPQQENYWDCGIFLLMYAEEFFRNPPLTFPPAPGSLRNWFNQATSHCPSKRRHHIRKVINDLYLEARELKKEPKEEPKTEPKEELKEEPKEDVIEEPKVEPKS